MVVDWRFQIDTAMSTSRKVVDINEVGKLSIDKCKKILNKNGNKYTDDEVKQIRDFYYILAEIDFMNFQRHKENEKNSNTIHEGIDRRAS